MLVAVTCTRARGVWRCTRFWPKGTTEAEVSTEELEILKAERHLTVKTLEVSTGAPRVESVQPLPVLPEQTEAPLPKFFEDTKLRKRQEQLLAQDAEYQERQRRDQARRDRPPPEGEEPEGAVVTPLSGAERPKKPGKK